MPVAGRIERQSRDHRGRGRSVCSAGRAAPYRAEGNPRDRRLRFQRQPPFHPDAIKTGIEAIKGGRDILTDVEMVRTGINKRLLSEWGGNVCADGGRFVRRAGQNMTRAESGIERAFKEKGDNIGIIAVGNAPTALLKVVELLKGRPAGANPLVVGVPVGLVRAVESKALLSDPGVSIHHELKQEGRHSRCPSPS